MLTFTKFAGINNVLPATRLSTKELAVALDVDIDTSGGIRRRQGYAETVAECHKNLWQAQGFILATRNGDLIARWPNGTVVLLYPAIGTARVWYCNLPDGRATFTNDSIAGITDGLTMTGWGVPLPASIGALSDVAGLLFPGDYQYAITHVRLSDGAESGPSYSNPLPIAAGGIVLTGLPTLAGHSTNVYLTGVNGGAEFFAGNTTNSVFTYTGKNSALVLPCRTNYLTPAPAGTITAFWRGRTLIADGKVMWASRTNQWELFDQRRDFKQFSENITLIVPVTNGVYVGTTKELLFLAGTEFDKLASSQVVAGSVVLGSGVAVRGEQIKKGDGIGEGRAMICIADRTIVAGFDNGDVVRMTESRYAIDPSVVEVSATFRTSNGVPQYLAVPQ